MSVMGCSSSLVLTTPPVAKVVPDTLKRKITVRVGNIEGPECFRTELMAYLASPGGLERVSASEREELTLDGGVRRIEVHSNRGDKEAAMLYFTVFVVTAPIAAAMYGAKDWYADAAAEGQLTATDPAGRVLWSKELTVSVAERQRSMPTDEALKAAMSSAACQKIAATLLNALAEHVAVQP